MEQENTHAKTTEQTPQSRRSFLQAGAVVGAATAMGFPHIGNAKAAATKTWKIQTSWPAGVGLEFFKRWCDSIIEKTGGELAFQAISASDANSNLPLFDAVKNGQLDAMNSFTHLWAERLPAAVFLCSYPMGLRNPHEWDVFYYGLGGLLLAREVYATQGLYYVGPIHHGPNNLYTKTPIRSIDDFQGRKMRLPGGMIAELFQAAGANTTLLPASNLYSALDNDVIDDDYLGPTINHMLGSRQQTDYISMGPPGFMSIYQPVGLMDLVVSMRSWHALSKPMQTFVEMETHVYSDLHHAAIQQADQEAWAKFVKAGTKITRLSQGDIDKFTKLAIPLWYHWAKKDYYAQQAFRIQLDYMKSGSLGYVTDEMIAGQAQKKIPT